MKTSRTTVQNYLLTGICVFFVSISVLLIAYAVFGMSPYGDKTVLIMDLDQQYVDFFAAMREMILGPDSFLYTWDMGLGGSFLGIFAYYLASPLSLITLLFPAKQLPLAIMVLNLLKVGLCGMTFSFYLEYRYHRHDLSAAAFSVFYALMSYNIVYSMSLMWLDGVIWLPILLIGVEKLLKENKCVLFTVGLAVLFFSNYYISYMVGIFCAAYFIYRFVVSGQKGMGLFVRKGLRFLGCALLAAGMSMVLLLPTAISMFAGKVGGYNYTAPGVFNFFLPQLMGKLFVGNYDSITNSGLPSIFCSVSVTVLALLFFLHKGFSVKDKLMAGGVLLFFVLSFCFKHLDMAWHMFQYPNWFPYRYAFVFCFFVLALGYRMFLKLAEVEWWKIAAVLGFLLIAATGVKLIGGDDLVSWESYGATAALFLVYSGILLGLRFKAKAATVWMAVLLVAAAGEGYYNAGKMIEGLDSQFHYKTLENYTGFQEEMQPLVEKMQQDSGAFYRVRKTFERSKNDALNLGYKGITHYSSVYSRALNEFLSNLGMAQYHMWCSDYGSTIVTDSLLGIKYVMTKYPGDGYSRYVTSSGDIDLYENPTALPLGYLADSEILSLSLEEGKGIQNQNAMVKAMSGTDADCFVKITDWQRSYQNLTLTAGNSGRTKFTKRNDDMAASVTYTFTAVSDEPIYLSFPSVVKRSCRLYVNGENLGSIFTNETTCTHLLGSFEAGEEVRVTLRLSGDTAEFSNPEFYRLDLSAWEAAYSLLADTSLSVDTFENTQVSGTINAGRDGVLVTSILADKGWTVKVDGETVEPQSFEDTLLCIPLSQGEHYVELSFFPRGLKMGAAVSVVSIGLGIGLVVWNKRRKKQPEPALLSTGN